MLARISIALRRNKQRGLKYKIIKMEEIQYTCEKELKFCGNLICEN